MATPTTQLDLAAIREQVLDTCRSLLAELGNQRAVAAVKGSAHLDRDLGLGSLERVELMVRLDAAFHVRLPDRAVAEADTPNDLASAVSVALSGNGATQTSAPALIEPASEPVHHPGVGIGADSAETLFDVLLHRARYHASEPHLFLYGDDESAVTITFGELFERADRVAHALSRRGISPGHTVAIMLPTSFDFFASFFGILLAGAIPVPIYPPFRADRIEEYAERQSAILQNAEARLLITFRSAEAVAHLLLPQVPSLEEVVNAEELAASPVSSREAAPGAGPILPHPPRGEDIAFLQYTSGSTGSPKGVTLTHANLLANIRAIGEVVGIGPRDVGVTWLPLYHDMGLIGTWLTPLYYGIPVSVHSPLAFLTRPERWLWAMHKHRGTLTAAPNFAFELCVRKVSDADIEGLDLSSMRAVLNGAEPVSAETLDRFAKRFAPYGLRREALTPVYGLAESALAVSVPPLGRAVRVDRVVRDALEREGRAVPATGSPADDPRKTISFVSVGRPLPRHEVRIVDRRGRDVPERIEGALWFRGPSATSGYYRNPQATAELFPEGTPKKAGEVRWLDSGDRAYRADGEIYVTGRVKDIIIKAGRNLYPQEVEEIVAGVQGVRRGCVVAFGLHDRGDGTERLVVAAESRAETEDARNAIARAITERVTSAVGLPPDAVAVLPPHSIPKTSSGKLRREETRRLYLAGTLAARRGPVWWQLTRLAFAGAFGLVRRPLRRGAEILYGVYALAIFGLWIVPASLVMRLARTHEVAAQRASSCFRVLLALLACPVRITARENLPRNEAVIYVSNHTSYFDVVVLTAALGGRFRFVAKKEVNDMPFVGLFMRQAGHLSFDRNDPEARLQEMQEIEQTLERGESVFIFPEGTFTSYEGVRPFQLGAFKACAVTRRAICPVVLRGTRRFLRDGTSLPRPSRVTLNVLPLIRPAANSSVSDWQEVVRLRDETRAAIAQASGEPLL